MKTGVIQSNSFIACASRCDASYHLSDGVSSRAQVYRSPYTIKTIGDASSNIFYGGRNRRIYVSSLTYGIPFLSSSSILKADLSDVKIVSKKLTPNVKEQMLEKDWILISRSGTIGNTAYTNETHAQKLASEHVIRIIPNDILKAGFMYAFLSSKYGYSLLTQGTFGAVIQHIEPDHVSNIPIPHFHADFQTKIDNQIKKAAELRVEASKLLEEAERTLKTEAKLADLTTEDYDYFGPRGEGRKVSCFVRNRKDIDTTTINAFNHSERIRKTKAKMTCPTKPLREVLLGGETFSSGSFPRVEVKEGHGVMLINQKDIFDMIVKGKYISKRGVKTDNMVEYGEVLIAGVGTLGESETFSRALFAYEDLVGQLVSGEFIRMKTKEECPSGYLYAWLATDYGFRFLRNIHAGTKLCRPIPKLVLEIPIPILSSETMNKIDNLVKTAHTMRFDANNCERKAISMIEKEIDSWK